jgi:hypothetical protein
MPVRDARGVVRGSIDGNDFIVSRRRDVHYLRAFGGWGLNSGVWQTIKRTADVLYLLIREPDTGDTYSARKMDLEKHEKNGDVQTINYADEQVVFLEAMFEKRESPQGRLF